MPTDFMTTCETPSAVGRERTRFFPRQLVTPDDLTQDQVYFREKLRRHNRMLHGWGIVCGVSVRRGASDCEVVIEPGYVLGPWGDEIYVDREVKVDVCRERTSGDAGSPCAELEDPWCTDVRVEREGGSRLYLAVRYAECEARPVRVSATACGCGEGDCQYSRLRDSFAVRVLTSLPTSYESMTPPSLADVTGCAGKDAHACPSCPAEPWVILAGLGLDTRGRVSTIDLATHRRYVASFGRFFYVCGIELDSLVVSPKRMSGKGTVTATVSLTGPAPAGGAVVTITGGTAAAPTPASVTVPAGQTSTSFEITVTPVQAKQELTIAGSYAGESRNATLTLVPLLKVQSAVLRNLVAGGDAADPNASQNGTPLGHEATVGWAVFNDAGNYAGPNALDIQFTGGQVDLASVKVGSTLRIVAGTVPMEVTQLLALPGNAIRIVGKFLPAVYTVTLSGSGSATVTSTDGARLDGELGASLPSGDSIEGGDCVMTVYVQFIG